MSSLTLSRRHVAAAEGAPFIAAHISRVTDKAFDDFAETGAEGDVVSQILGLNELRPRWRPTF
jgi:hypothetical protein